MPRGAARGPRVGLTQHTRQYALMKAFQEDRLTFIAPDVQLSPHGWQPEMQTFTFTALREPRARTLAHFRAVSGAVGAERFGAELWPATYGEAARLDRAPTLAEFLGWVRDSRNDNFFVRFFLGLREVDRPLDAADLEAAQAVLQDQMNFVLITERWGEAGCLLRKLGWAVPATTAGPEMAGKVERAEAGEAAEAARLFAEAGGTEEAAAAKALLDELTGLDGQLYAYARTLFVQQLQRCTCCEAKWPQYA